MRAQPRTYTIARRLRRVMTPPEVLLWQRLRAPGEGSPRFRRQHPMGSYVLDFYCPAARLAIEVDGIAHSMGDRPERDALRDAWLIGRGLRVLRIAAIDVLADAGVVADGIVRLVMAGTAPPPSATPPPPPLRGRG